MMIEPYQGRLADYPFPPAACPPRPAPSPDGRPVLFFEGLSAFPELIHAFTVRQGGVSTGCHASMNLSFTRGDRDEDVRENHRLMAGYLGYDASRAVLSHQTHTDNIFAVTADDAGKGVSREKGYTGIDGLLTAEPGIALIIFTADCVPVLLYDPVRKACGAVHAGWRGTAADIVKKAVRKMTALYGTDPKDIRAGIGPSIGPCCYEVSEELGRQFAERFPDADDIVLPGAPGHAMLDLWQANRRELLEAGVPDGQIEVTNLCTKCLPDLFFSHRVSGEERGNVSGIICLRETGTVSERTGS